MSFIAFINKELLSFIAQLRLFLGQTLKPYAFSFAMSNSWSSHSKNFDNSVNKAPNILV